LDDGGIEDSPERRVDGEAHRHVASFGAVLVEAHGATEAGVLVQGDEASGQVSPSWNVTARVLFRDYHVLNLRVAPHSLVRCLGSV
jgi:hypothetical protein